MCGLITTILRPHPTQPVHAPNRVLLQTIFLCFQVVWKKPRAIPTRLWRFRGTQPWPLLHRTSNRPCAYCQIRVRDPHTADNKPHRPTRPPMRATGAAAWRRRVWRKKVIRIYIKVYRRKVVGLYSRIRRQSIPRWLPARRCHQDAPSNQITKLIVTVVKFLQTKNVPIRLSLKLR